MEEGSSDDSDKVTRFNRLASTRSRDAQAADEIPDRTVRECTPDAFDAPGFVEPPLVEPPPDPNLPEPAAGNDILNLYPQGDVLTLQCNLSELGDFVMPVSMDPLATAVSVGIFEVPAIQAGTVTTHKQPNPAHPAESGNFPNSHYHRSHPHVVTKHQPDFNQTHVVISQNIAAIKHFGYVSDEAFLASMVIKGLKICTGFQTNECPISKDHFIMGVTHRHACAMCYKIKKIPLKHNLFECPFISVCD
jgi:hypothetical protein